MHLSRVTRYACVALLAAHTLLQTSIAHAKPPVGQRWPQSQLVAIDKIDHGPLNTLLAKYVDEDGYVNYAGWQRSQTDRQALLAYLSSLGKANPQLRCSKEARLAFWINAYNALTIEGILQEYPTTSIRNHTAKLFGYNIWKELPLIVGSSQHSLEHIEHEILRKMGEPRIHFAIVCASIGCPRLRNEAYVADRLEKQLADNARDFFSRPGNFRYDANQRTMQVSAILNWFAADFGDTQVEQFTRVKQYLPPAAQQLAVSPRTQLSYLDYNWSINDQTGRIAHRPGK
ncbi:MAG: DUF547 domain-containing protein [Rhodopirellula sp.]|nr:DUF547 domain-containing protein [Rhodopirellula sp.]